MLTEDSWDQDNWNKTKDPDANKACPNGNPFITFAGNRWWINYWWSKETGTYVWGNDGQFRSNFDPKQFVRLNNYGLTLRAFGTEQDKCITSEIVLEDIVGCGDYVVTARADQGSFAKLDDNVVFGIFTYQWGEAPPAQGKNTHREIDLLETISEAAQGYKGNAQFALQPAFDLPVPNLLHRFTIPDTEYITAHMFRSSGDMGLELYTGNYSYNDLFPPGQPEQRKLPIVGASWDPVVDNQDHNKIVPYVPKHTPQSCERLHINLYLVGGRPPRREQSITLTRFEYKPLK
jgi:hypothetical protein